MEATVTVSDSNGIVFGRFIIDKGWIATKTWQTNEAIGEAVVEQLPGRIRYLIDDGEPNTLRSA